jgi:hypothetical protein
MLKLGASAILADVRIELFAGAVGASVQVIAATARAQRPATRRVERIEWGAKWSRRPRARARRCDIGAATQGRRATSRVTL